MCRLKLKLLLIKASTFVCKVFYVTYIIYSSFLCNPTNQAIIIMGLMKEKATNLRGEVWFITIF